MFSSTKPHGHGRPQGVRAVALLKRAELLQTMRKLLLQPLGLLLQWTMKRAHLSSSFQSCNIHSTYSCWTWRSQELLSPFISPREQLLSQNCSMYRDCEVEFPSLRRAEELGMLCKAMTQAMEGFLLQLA